jgi:hypothetical protein
MYQCHPKKARFRFFHFFHWGLTIGVTRSIASLISALVRPLAS